MPHLDPQQEHALAVAAAAGDRGARAQLIEANLDLVQQLARTIPHRRQDLDELVAAGNLALVEAVDTFDPSKGARVRTHAAHHIRHALRAEASSTTLSIHVPDHVKRCARQWRRAHRRLTAELGRPPSPDEITARLALTPSAAVTAQRVTNLRLTLSTSLGPHQSLTTVLDACGAATPDDDPLDSRYDDLALIGERWPSLTAPERATIALHFGFDGPPLTNETIGQALGVSRERARQILHSGIAKLRSPTDSTTKNRRQPRRWHRSQTKTG